MIVTKLRGCECGIFHVLVSGRGAELVSEEDKEDNCVSIEAIMWRVNP